MTAYQVLFENCSTNEGSVILFQPQEGSVHSLAWIAKKSIPHSKVLISWDDQCDFVWSETGRLSDQVTFTASQTLPASPGDQIKFTYRNQMFRFTDQENNPDKPDVLSIEQDSSIPMLTASVGIGMAGNPMYVVQAQPNQAVIFNKPAEKYWIAFGNYKLGQVVDSISNAQSLDFDTWNIKGLHVTLDQKNSWNVQPLVSFRTKSTPNPLNHNP